VTTHKQSNKKKIRHQERHSNCFASAV